MSNVPRACQRCKRLKVRCVTEEGENSCTRCLKAGQECIAAAPTGGTPRTSGIRKADNRARMAYVDKFGLNMKQAFTQEDVAEKSRQLERIINEAKNELANLKPQYATLKEPSELQDVFNSIAPGIIQSPQQSHAQGGQQQGGQQGQANHQDIPDAKQWWLPQILQQINPVVTLVQSGLMSQHEIEQCYRMYLNQMSYFCPIGYDHNSTLDQNMSKEPITTAAMVVTARINSNRENAEHIMEFMERVIVEKTVMQGERTLEIVRSMVIMNSFCQTSQDPRFTFYFLNAMSLINQLNIGGRDDCKALLSLKSGPAAAKMAHERIEMFMFMNMTMQAVNLHVNPRHQTVNMLPSATVARDSILSSKHVTPTNKLITSCSKILEIAQECNSQLDQPWTGEHDYSIVKSILDKGLERVHEIMQSVEMIVTSNTYLRAAASVYSSLFQSMQLTMYETALTQVVFGTHSAPTAEELQQFIKPMLGMCDELIQNFNSMLNYGSLIPRYVYFRPIFTLCTLVRLRMITWGLNLDIPVDVDGAYNQVKATWDQLATTSHIAVKSQQMLRKVDQWRSLRLTPPANNGGDQNINALLKTLLKEIMTANATANNDRNLEDKSPLITVDAKEVLFAPPDFEVQDETIDPALSEVDYEGMLKELFSELYRN